jgi:hypothetical protein
MADGNWGWARQPLESWPYTHYGYDYPGSEVFTSKMDYQTDPFRHVYTQNEQTVFQIAAYSSQLSERTLSQGMVVPGKGQLSANRNEGRGYHPHHPNYSLPGLIQEETSFICRCLVYLAFFSFPIFYLQSQLSIYLSRHLPYPTF